MTSPFWYLTLCSFRGWFRVRVRRLREPRYLIGLGVGILYLYGTIFRNMAARGHAPQLSKVFPIARIAGELQLGGAVLLFVLAALAWLLPGSKRGMAFSSSEVQFLFTAPVTRRQLVNYKLLRSQGGLLFGSVVATLLFRPQTLATSWTLVVGLWIAFTTASLYMNGVALRRLSLSQHGRSGWRHEWWPIVVILAAAGVLVGAVVREWPALASAADYQDVLTALERIANVPAVGVVLWPFMALLKVPTALSTREALAALPAALGLTAIAYVWALRSDAAFEEASAERAEKVAAARKAPSRLRAKAGPTPFTLALTGRPEFAILWKNLIMPGRYFGAKTMLRLLPVVLVVILVAHDSQKVAVAAVLAIGCLVLAGYTVLLGPQIARNDLRQDLAFLPVLKTWPMTGKTILRGEILAPAAILTALIWLFVLVGMAALGDKVAPHFTASQRLSYTIAALILAPGLILTQLVVQNAIAVIWPAWVAIGTSRARGIDVMGQRLLMLAGMMLTLVAALVPAGIVGGGVAFAVYWVAHVVIVVVPALLAAAVLIMECVIAIELLGGVFDRTDPSSLEATD